MGHKTGYVSIDFDALYNALDDKDITMKDVCKELGASDSYISGAKCRGGKISKFFFTAFCLKCGLNPNDYIITATRAETPFNAVEKVEKRLEMERSAERSAERAAETQNEDAIYKTLQSMNKTMFEIICCLRDMKKSACAD